MSTSFLVNSPRSTNEMAAQLRINLEEDSFQGSSYTSTPRFNQTTPSVLITPCSTARPTFDFSQNQVRQYFDAITPSLQNYTYTDETRTEFENKISQFWSSHNENHNQINRENQTTQGKNSNFSKQQQQFSENFGNLTLTDSWNHSHNNPNFSSELWVQDSKNGVKDRNQHPVRNFQGQNYHNHQNQTNSFTTPVLSPTSRTIRRPGMSREKQLVSEHKEDLLALSEDTLSTHSLENESTHSFESDEKTQARTLDGSKHKAWMNQDILEMIEIRDKLYRRMKKSPNSREALTLYKKARNAVVSLTRAAKRNYDKDNGIITTSTQMPSVPQTFSSTQTNQNISNLQNTNYTQGPLNHQQFCNPNQNQTESVQYSVNSVRNMGEMSGYENSMKPHASNLSRIQGMSHHQRQNSEQAIISSSSSTASSSSNTASPNLRRAQMASKQNNVNGSSVFYPQTFSPPNSNQAFRSDRNTGVNSQFAPKNMSFASLFNNANDWPALK
jgi:hypothetical protein